MAQPETGRMVPEIVFERLTAAPEECIRVALWMLANAPAKAEDAAAALNLTSALAREAVFYWRGAGLELEKAACSAEKPMLRLRTRLSTPEVTAAAEGDPSVALLVQECQTLFGRVITESDVNILVSLYVSDGIPVDVILIGVAHYASQGRNVRYIEKALLGWQREGIVTGEAAEAHLKLLAQRAEREARVAKLLGMESDAALTKSERALINEWYEGFGFGDDMVAEALGYAGERRTVRYLNGILRKWYGKGWKTVRDVMSESASKMQNIQTSNPHARDVMTGGLRRAPVFHTNGGGQG